MSYINLSTINKTPLLASLEYITIADDIPERYASNSMSISKISHNT